MPQFLLLIIIIRIITYYDYFYLKAVRQHKDCYYILLMLEMFLLANGLCTVQNKCKFH